MSGEEQEPPRAGDGVWGLLSLRNSCRLFDTSQNQGRMLSPLKEAAVKVKISTPLSALIKDTCCWVQSRQTQILVGIGDRGKGVGGHVRGMSCLS